MRTTIAALSIVLLIAAGCSYQPAPVPPAKEAVGQQSLPKPTPMGSSGEIPSPAPTYEKAQVGVGARGKGYGGDMITEPVRQYFRIREQINFLMLDKAMRDFKVLNERLPKDQEEFDKVMSENAVRFPQLNPGERYVYDPKTGELMVEHPQ